MEINYIVQRQVPCQIWSRVCGFFRPIQNFNIGKKEEYSQRKEIDPKQIGTAIKNYKSERVSLV
jgi:hypothetical protein